MDAAAPPLWPLRGAHVPGAGKLGSDDVKVVKSWPGGELILEDNTADLYVLYRVTPEAETEETSEKR